MTSQVTPPPVFAARGIQALAGAKDSAGIVCCNPLTGEDTIKEELVDGDTVCRWSLEVKAGPAATPPRTYLHVRSRDERALLQEHVQSLLTSPGQGKGGHGALGQELRGT